jgi:hypothetical protein
MTLEEFYLLEQDLQATGQNNKVDIPVDSRPPIPVIHGHLVRDFVRRYN